MQCIYMTTGNGVLIYRKHTAFVYTSSMTFLRENECIYMTTGNGVLIYRKHTAFVYTSSMTFLRENEYPFIRWW